MRVITSTEKITISLSEDEVLDKKWVNVSLISDKLNTIENENRMGYKSLRGKFYNSLNSNKYNVVTIAGVNWIDGVNPMKATASLELKFIIK